MNKKENSNLAQQTSLHQLATTEVSLRDVKGATRDTHKSQH